jgi:hypothetical protein
MNTCNSANGSDDLDLQTAVEKLYFWRHSHTGCFSERLFDLIAKADFPNRAKLALAFPCEVQAFELWQAAEDRGEALFRDFQVGIYSTPSVTK